MNTTKAETHINTVVAVTSEGILPPCGRCRETMTQIDLRNLDCTVIISEEEDVRLGDLLPDHWTTRNEDRQADRSLSPLCQEPRGAGLR